MLKIGAILASVLIAQLAQGEAGTIFAEDLAGMRQSYSRCSGPIGGHL